jgi:hypothetical protein
MTPKKPMRIIGIIGIGCFVTLLWICQVMQSGWCIDESAHIPAGLYHLQTGQMDAYRVNPPLPRMLAALPLLVAGPEIQWRRSESPYFRNEYQFAKTWIREQQSQLRFQLILARIAVLPFYLVGLWVTWRWTSQMYGSGPAYVASLMWLLSPDILTHSAVVAPDLPATSTGMLVGYFYWRWITEKSERPYPVSIAIVAGLAMLCKFTWLLLFFALPMMTFMNDLMNRRRYPFQDTWRLTLSLSLSLLVINLGYGFAETGTRLADFQFISKSLSGNFLGFGQTDNRFNESLYGLLPIPLPADMVRGVDFLKWEFEQNYFSYLRGTWARQGWWYFYVYAMAVKMPAGFWLLILAGLASECRDWLIKRTPISGEWVPLVLACLFLGLVSSQTGFTHHVRYVLPCFAFLFILASRVLVGFESRWRVVFSGVCLIGTLCFHLTHFGLAHTFFNPFAGGPKMGWKHLSHSNVDWGQSTYRMLSWVSEHPDQRPLLFLHATMVSDPLDALPTGPHVYFDKNALPGNSGNGHWVLMSSMQLTLAENREFWNQEPYSRPYPDILVYWVPAK